MAKPYRRGVEDETLFGFLTSQESLILARVEDVKRFLTPQSLLCNDSSPGGEPFSVHPPLPPLEGRCQRS